MPKRLLHVGCGGDPRPDWAKDYTETRLDIDESCHPDIVASMTSLGEIGTYDAVYCCHALEHLFPHEVVTALSEFRRVLNPEGFAMVMVPDLEDVKATDEVILDAPCGPITGLDMIYGKLDLLAEKPYMAHKTGFVKATLDKAFAAAGFANIFTRRLDDYNLIGVGAK